MVWRWWWDSPSLSLTWWNSWWEAHHRWWMFVFVRQLLLEQQLFLLLLLSLLFLATREWCPRWPPRQVRNLPCPRFGGWRGFWLCFLSETKEGGRKGLRPRVQCFTPKYWRFHFKRDIYYLWDVVLVVTSWAVTESILTVFAFSNRVCLMSRHKKHFSMKTMSGREPNLSLLFLHRGGASSGTLTTSSGLRRARHKYSKHYCAFSQRIQLQHNSNSAGQMKKPLQGRRKAARKHLILKTTTCLKASWNITRCLKFLRKCRIFTVWELNTVSLFLRYNNNNIYLLSNELNFNLVTIICTPKLE